MRLKKSLYVGRLNGILPPTYPKLVTQHCPQQIDKSYQYEVIYVFIQAVD
jgi:hypothetical protein